MKHPLFRLALLGALACAPPPELEPPLVLETVQPGEGSQLLLNEPLTLVFSAPLDPISVTEASVALRRQNGEPVAGRWDVHGRALHFHPRPVMDPDLMDGGYRPGEQLLCEVRGFPYVNGLRTDRGVPLVRTYRRQLSVVDFGQRLFADETRFTSSPVHFGSLPGAEAYSIYEGEPIRLVCEEPLDPASLDEAQFWIERLNRFQDPQSGTGDGPPANGKQASGNERISGLTARLVRNDPPNRRGQLEPSAVIELIPTTPLPASYTPEDVYVLQYAPTVSLMDFGGNLAWQRDPQALRDRFRVEPLDHGGPDSVRLDFPDTRRLTSTRVPWADGTARAEGGRVVARFPAVAGKGTAGAVTLEGALESRDLHAHSLEVPEGAEVNLPAGPGLRVVRTQGGMRITGTLQRGETGAAVDPVPLDVTQELGITTASGFLAHALQEDRDWTILVAGGDLWVEGSVICATPLILVAGGRIRIDGKVRSADNQLFLLGEGGSNSFQRMLDLDLDPPQGNPLSAPITLALLTSPLPGQVRERYLWRGLEVGQAAGRGSARVRFLPANAPLEVANLVDHPGELPTDQPLRVLIELQLLDPQSKLPGQDSERAELVGETWDPPAVDFVTFSWDDR